MRRLFAVSLALVLAGCSSATTSPSASPSMPPSMPSTPATASEQPSPRPSPNAASIGSSLELAWTPVSGLDLRGAYVANGAASATRIVLLGADTTTGALLSWISTNGVDWARHWLPGTTFGGNTPTAIVAGDFGFVASGWTTEPDLQVTPAMWTSADGIEWSLAPGTGGRFEVDREEVASTSSSIVMSACCLISRGRTLMTSSDGLTWVDATPPDAGLDHFFHLAAAGDRFLAVANVDLGAADGSTTLAAWQSPNGRDWTRDAAIDRGLRAVSGVNGVIGAGDRFIVVDDSGGFQEIAEDGSLVRIDQATTYGGPLGGKAGLAWLGPPDDGPCLAGWLRWAGAWRPVEPYPNGCAAEQGLARRIALSDGWLIVASDGASPAESVWAVRPHGLPIGDAPGGLAPTPPTAAIPEVPTGRLTAAGPCPADPPSITDVVHLRPYDRAACFGSRELTLRAWVVDPGEGYGGTCEPLTPRWLYSCVLPEWLLAADKGSTDRLDGLKRPDARGDLKGVGRWVRVTGHFDDPAAATCRLEDGPARIGAPPTAWYVLRCREQFAVTRIETNR